jgi:hypothetical protein
MAPGASLKGSYTGGPRTITAKFRASGAIRLGFDCLVSAGGCTNLSQGNNLTMAGSVDLNNLSAVSLVRNVKPGAFMDFRIKMATSLELINARAVGEESLDFAPLNLQIAENNPADYGIEFYTQIGSGQAVKDLIGFLLGNNVSTNLQPLKIPNLSKSQKVDKS